MKHGSTPLDANQGLLLACTIRLLKSLRANREPAYDVPSNRISGRRGKGNVGIKPDGLENSVIETRATIDSNSPKVGDMEKVRLNG
jgi:hypothetical protein